MKRQPGIKHPPPLTFTSSNGNSLIVLLYYSYYPTSFIYTKATLTEDTADSTTSGIKPCSVKLSIPENS